jgi:hypothetical protein
MAVILRILLVILFFYVILIGYLFFNRRNMVYFPLREITDTPAAVGLPFREIVFKTSDGLRLCGWMVAAREPRQFLRISGSHNEGFSDSRGKYIIGFRRFLERSR